MLLRNQFKPRVRFVIWISNPGRGRATAWAAAALLACVCCIPASGQRRERGHQAPVPRFSAPPQRGNGGFGNPRFNNDRNFQNRENGSRGYENPQAGRQEFRNWQRNWQAQRQAQARRGQDNQNRQSRENQGRRRQGYPGGWPRQGAPNDPNGRAPQGYPRGSRPPSYPGAGQRAPYQPPPSAPRNGYSGPGYGSQTRQPYTPQRPLRAGHLPEWLNQHRGTSVQQQERLLRSDPSFKTLPRGDQQRLMQQLRQVDRMPAPERERRLARNEMIERLSPEEQMRINRSATQFRGLPQDRRALVRQAFQDLRSVPMDQRQTVLDSARYQHMFSPQERGILSNLLRVEPYQPPPQ